MAAPSDEWRAFREEFSQLTTNVEKVTSKHVNSARLRADIGQIAQRYLTHIRPILIGAGLTELADVFNGAFSNLLQLSEGRNLLPSYKKQIKRIRKSIPPATTGLAMSADPGDALGQQQSGDEGKLLRTLGELLPTAAISYRQALTDVRDDARLSFRGPALEFREVLREVLDHMAADADVMSSPGYKPEKDENGKDRTKPTMRQKVRFILKARGEGKTGSAVPEDATNAVDAIVSKLTRSVYELGSLAAHVTSERVQVLNLKRYVEAVLHDILEIS